MTLSNIAPDPKSTPQVWRVIIDAPTNGTYNMARDAYLLQRAAQYKESTLRIYHWEQLTLSLGRAQRIEGAIDGAACRAAGVCGVRRMTGGQAVLHGTDLTYAVAAPRDALGGEIAAGGILSIYRALSEVFIRFFQRLGLSPQAKAHTRSQRNALASPVCFATPSSFEILHAGRKLVGSAQRLLPNAFLQHGSIPCEPQDALLARIFCGTSRHAAQGRMCDLRSLDIIPRYSIKQLRQQLVQSFAEMLGGRIEISSWSAEEEASVRELCAAYPPLLWEAPEGNVG